jgi:membrane protein
MKRIISNINKNDDEDDIVVLSLWKRLLILLFYYLRLGLHDIGNTLSYVIDPKKRMVLLVNIKNFCILFYRKAAQEAILKESAALTYITLIGFIPFLMLVVFIIPKLPVFAGANKVQSQLYQNFLPLSTGDFGWMISQLVTKQISFNIFSLILVTITSYSLFQVIRNTFDRILVMEFQPPKDLIGQILKFFGTLIFGFLIILLLFSSSSLPILSSVLKIPLFRKQLIFILPFVTQFIALVFMYMILPSIKVKRSSLFRGAFWTTLVWVTVKSLFDYYIYNLTNIQAVYGVLKSIPIFLLWIYVNWIIILGGIVLVSILELKEKAVRKKEEKHFVRLTMEMYTDKKLDKQIDAIINKDTIPKIIESLTKEETK